MIDPEKILIGFNTGFIVAAIIAILGGILAILSKKKLWILFGMLILAL